MTKSRHTRVHQNTHKSYKSRFQVVCRQHTTCTGLVPWSLRGHPWRTPGSANHHTREHACRQSPTISRPQQWQGGGWSKQKWSPHDLGGSGLDPWPINKIQSTGTVAPHPALALQWPGPGTAASRPRLYSGPIWPRTRKPSLSVTCRVGHPA